MEHIRGDKEEGENLLKMQDDTLHELFDHPDARIKAYKLPSLRRDIPAISCGVRGKRQHSARNCRDAGTTDAIL